MDLETTKSNYKKVSTKELLKLVSKIKLIEPEVVSLLQDELIRRGEVSKAIRINDYLISIKYQINNEIIFNSIVKLRKKGFSEIEIDKKLSENHKIDPNYIQLLKSFLKKRGKENITYGILMILFSFLLGIFFLIISHSFIVLLMLLLLLGVSAKFLNLGMSQTKINN